MSNVKINFKSAYKLYNKRARTSITAILITVLLLSVTFLTTFNPDSFFASASDPIPDTTVGNEFGLNTAINNAQTGSPPTPYIIGLTSDITLTSPLIIPADTSITLISATNEPWKLIGSNDNTTIIVNGTLELYDITVTHTAEKTGRGVTINSLGTFILHSGEISGNTHSDGAGVAILGDAAFTMNGGKIHDNTAPDSDGGAVWMYGNFEMTNGEIFNNTATSGGGILNYNATLTMNGGKIHSNTATIGGGIMNFATCIMTDGEIFNNTGGYGGGINNDLSGTFTMSGGKIFDNTCSYGGGIFNYGSFTMSGTANISNNTASRGGGGVWIQGPFTMASGIISNNTAQSGGGICIANDIGGSGKYGTATLNGGEISNNTASGNGGGIWVTDTNTNLARLTVNAGVIFSNNHASTAYAIDPTDQPTYNTQIHSNIWTTPFTQGYNNYDISYTSNHIYYNVTVQNSYTTSNGAGLYYAGETVTINAGSRSHYSFSGWIINEGGIGSLPNTPTATFIMPSNDVEVTVNWTPIDYTIHYELDGGYNAAGNPTSYNILRTTLISIDNPTKPDYVFLGWIAEYSDGTPNITEPDIFYSVPIGTTGNIVLTAKWQQRTDDVPYVVDGRILPPVMTGDTVDWIEIARYGDSSLIVRTSYINWYGSSNYNDPTWQHTKYGTGNNYNRTSDNCVVRSYINTWFNGNPAGLADKLRADARLRNYTMESNALSICGSTATDASLTDGFSIPSSTQIRTGDDVAFALSFSEVAEFLSMKYDLYGAYPNHQVQDSNSIANTNFGKITIPQIHAYGMWLRSFPVSPTLATSAGALTNDGRVFQFLINEDANEFGLVYPALWVNSSIFVCNITYVLNGGVNAPDNPYSYHVDDLPVHIAPPSGFGYPFLSWTIAYANGTSTPLPSEGIPIGAAGDVVLTAHWDYGSPFSYDISYDANGGTGVMANTPAVFHTFVSLRENSFSRYGYNFAGWNTAANSSGDAFTGGQTFNYTYADDLNLYAQWTLDTSFAFKITYELLGGTNDPMNPITYTVSGLPCMIYDAAWGYPFLGWTITYADGTSADLPVGGIPLGTVGDVVLTAKWDYNNPFTYTISYDANNGAGTMDSTLATFNASVTLRQNAFSRVDYVFIGWTTEADGSGTAYGDMATFNYTYTDHLTLYAVWLVAGGVSKDITGGSSSYAKNAVVAYEINYVLHSDVSAIESFIITDTWTPVGGLSYVTAVVELGGLFVDASQYNITDGLGQVNFVFDPAVLGDGMTVKITLTFTVEDVTSGVTNTATLIVNGHSIDTDETGLYRVTYSANGVGVIGDVPVDPVLYKTGSSVVVLGKGDLALDGCTFIGWLYNGSVYTAGDTFEIFADAELVAQWVTTGGVTKVDSGSGSYGVGTSVAYVVSYTLPSDMNAIESFAIVDYWSPASGLTFVDAVVTVGDSVVSAPSVNHTVSAGQVSFVFDPVVLSAGAEVEITFSFTVAEISVGISNSATVAINGQTIGTDEANLFRILYAENWPSGLTGTGSVPVDSKWYVNGSSVVVSDCGDLALEGYTFIGWLYSGVVYNVADTFTIGEDVVLRAVWRLIPDPNVYTISYVLNGGVNVAGNPSLYVVGDLPLEIAPPYREGYAFLHWIARYANGTERMLVDSIIPRGVSGDIVLTAYWSPGDIYAIHYDLAGGINAPGNPSSYVVDNLPLAIVDPTRIDYEFAGWTVTYADGTEVASQFSYSIPVGTTGDVVLHAAWNPIGFEVYSIFYELEGGINAPSNPSSYVVEDLPVAIADPTRDGNDFLGWMVEYADGTVDGPVSAFVIPVGTTGDITLIATWLISASHLKYSVTYNGNGQTGGTVPIDNNSPYDEGSQVTVLGQGSLSQSGYTFLGWATTSNTNTAIYTAGSTFTITANTVLYAVWRPTSTPTYYTVTYQPGAHGTFTVQTKSNLVYGDPTPVAPKATGASGWQFTGWSPVPSATVTGNVVYVAQWIQEQPAMLIVQFVDWNGTFLKSQTVPYGGNATAPNDPTREGYTFTGWDKECTNVTSNLTITAQYTANSEPPTLQTWAFANLMLSIVGIILAVIAVIYVLLQQRRQKDKQQKNQSTKQMTTNDPLETEQHSQNSNQERLYRNLCLIIAFALSIIGVAVFLLTEDLSLPMGWIDGWTIVNIAIFAVELLSLAFVLKPPKKSREQENKDNSDSASTDPSN